MCVCLWCGGVESWKSFPYLISSQCARAHIYFNLLICRNDDHVASVRRTREWCIIVCLSVMMEAHAVSPLAATVVCVIVVPVVSEMEMWPGARRRLNGCNGLNDFAGNERDDRGGRGFGLSEVLKLINCVLLNW